MATIRTAIQINDMMSQQFRAMNMAMSTVIDSFQTLQDATSNAIDTSALEIAQRELQQVEANFNQVEEEIKQANAAQQQLNNSLHTGASAADGLLGKIKGLVSTYLTIQGVKWLLGLSDEEANITARLNLINDGLQTTAELQQMIFESANRTLSPYRETADVIGRLGLLAGKVFSSNEEMIAFAEQMNKQFAIGGASIQEQTSAMYQLTQAMAAGRLQGDEFVSIMENAPLLAQSIADYMDVTIGELREMSSEGLITADVIKNALFAAADETNRQFAELPITFSQLGTLAGNILQEAFNPTIQWIGKGAQWIYDNWSTIAPLFYGLATAVGVYAVAMGIQTTVTWLSVEAHKALIVTMLKNPILWVALAIGVLISIIYKWIQSVGGIEIAWKIAMNGILTALDWVKIGFFTGFYWIMNMWDRFLLGTKVASVGLQNIIGDMKVNVLMIIQNMVNDGINIINDFINKLNMIPGVSIDLVDQVTFGTTAQIENEIEKNSREYELNNFRNHVDGYIAYRNAMLDQMKLEARSATAQRLAEIEAMQAQATTENNDNSFDYSSVLNDLNLAAKDTAGNTKKMADHVSMSAEDIKYLRDISEREAINQYTTGNITIEMKNENHINSELDIDGVIDRFGERAEEVAEMLAEGNVLVDV